MSLSVTVPGHGDGQRLRRAPGSGDRRGRAHRGCGRARHRGSGPGAGPGCARSRCPQAGEHHRGRGPCGGLAVTCPVHPRLVSRQSGSPEARRGQFRAGHVFELFSRVDGVKMLLLAVVAVVAVSVIGPARRVPAVDGLLQRCAGGRANRVRVRLPAAEPGACPGGTLSLPLLLIWVAGGAVSLARSTQKSGKRWTAVGGKLTMDGRNSSRLPATGESWNDHVFPAQPASTSPGPRRCDTCCTPC